MSKNSCWVGTGGISFHVVFILGNRRLSRATASVVETSLDSMVAEYSGWQMQTTPICKAVKQFFFLRTQVGGVPAKEGLSIRLHQREGESPALRKFSGRYLH